MKSIVFSLIALASIGVGNRADADFITVSASAMFTETQSATDANADRSGDLFTISNNSEFNQGIQISSISITLPSNVLFDTFEDNFGTNPSSDFQPIPSSTGITYSSPTAFGSSFDGSQVLTLNFTGFDSGESFSFNIDVDNTTGTTDIEKRQVLGSVFAGLGAGFKVTFASSKLENPQSFSSSFLATTPSRLTALSFAGGDVETIANPEPASVLLFGVGMAGVLVAFRKRTTAAGTD